MLCELFECATNAGDFHTSHSQSVSFSICLLCSCSAVASSVFTQQQQQSYRHKNVLFLSFFFSSVASETGLSCDLFFPTSQVS